MDSSSPPSSSRRSRRDRGRERFLFRAILPAIRGRSCPICLETLREDQRTAVIAQCMHAFCLACIRRWSELKRKCPLCNAEFDSWFSGISLRYRSFLEEKAPNEEHDRHSRPLSYYLRNRRINQSSSHQFSARSRPLQWQRSFGRPGSIPPDVIAERKLQWRASIYNRRLRAVVPSPGRLIEQNVSRNNGWKERLLERIEPWVRRELQAILGDPDPSVIVHVATSLFLRSMEDKINSPSMPVDEVSLSAPLQPFLHNRANMFWHELSCYAKCSLAMETYDAVVEYEQLV